MEGLKIRWMASGDLDCVGAMSERSGLKIPLMKMTRKCDFICVVSEVEGTVNGFALYKIRPRKIILKHLVVEEESRRMGIGSRLIAILISKMSERRSVVEAKVSEYNLAAQLFFKSLAFRAEEVLGGYEGEYMFRRHLN